MYPGSAFSVVCSCGREFTKPGALKNHQNFCVKRKKRLSNALAKAKELAATTDPPKYDLEPEFGGGDSTVEENNDMDGACRQDLFSVCFLTGIWPSRPRRKETREASQAALREL